MTENVPTPAGWQQPRFSVVVPALDEAAVLAGCLDSLAGQDLAGRVEVIVVDNGSTDATSEVARAHGAVVVAEPRRGVCYARQRGLEVATGSVVVSTDADTTFAPGWLATIDATFRQHPGAVAVAGPCVYVDGPRWSVLWQRAIFGAVAWWARRSGYVGYVTATNLAFRRESFDGYDTRLTQGGDELDVLRRLRRRGPVVFTAGNPTFTSARRLRRGLLYNVVVSLGFYYLLGYLVNRLTGRTLLGTAPAVRPPSARDGSSPRPATPRRGPRVAVGAAVLTGLVLVMGMAWRGGLG